MGTVLDAIGNTPIAELRKIAPPGCARIVAKLEWGNPTGSMKDRMARAAIEAAERDGRLPPGGTVVEATMGTTGISLALVCAAKGYGLHIVFSDAFSDEKRRTMRAFGATVEDVPSDHGLITEALVKAMLARAHELTLRVAAVEPAESAVLSGQPSGSHKIEGIGIGFVPPLWEPEEVDEIIAVTTAEAKAMTRRLAREEGLLAGA